MDEQLLYYSGTCRCKIHGHHCFIFMLELAGTIVTLHWNGRHASLGGSAPGQARLAVVPTPLRQPAFPPRPLWTMYCSTLRSYAPVLLGLVHTPFLALSSEARSWGWKVNCRSL
ncbi:hypothetical protein BaRGS_00019688 [Batillaria attramentaria]|uniref:Uncharacterized protein n=1 Tax=Batillaria attramentaria TaxID=370345 RepID=A0ABD0KQ76_9CAEN